MVWGNPSSWVPKRWALKIWGTRQQSAKVGVAPWQYTDGGKPAACLRAAWLANCRSKASSPERTQWWYQAIFVSSSTLISFTR